MDTTDAIHQFSHISQILRSFIWEVIQSIKGKSIHHIYVQSLILSPCIPQKIIKPPQCWHRIGEYKHNQLRTSHLYIMSSNLWATSSLIFTIQLLPFIFHMEIKTQQITILVPLFILLWREELRTSIFNCTDGWNIPRSEKSSYTTISSWILPPHKQYLRHSNEWCGRQPEETIHELIGQNNSNS